MTRPARPLDARRGRAGACETSATRAAASSASSSAAPSRAAAGSSCPRSCSARSRRRVASVAAVETAEPGFGGSLAAVAALLVHLFFADLAAGGDPRGSPVGARGPLARPGGRRRRAGLARGAGGLLSLDRGRLQPGARAPAALAPLGHSRRARGADPRRGASGSGFLARAYAHSGVLPGRAAPAGLSRRRRRPACSSRRSSLLVAPRGAAGRPRPSLAARRLRRRRRRRRPGARRRRRTPRSPELLCARAPRAGGRPRRLSPPEIWRIWRRGASARRHGVRALARVRPRGIAAGAAAAASGTSWYLRGLGPAAAAGRQCAGVRRRPAPPRLLGGRRLGRASRASRSDGGLPGPGRAPMSSETRRSSPRPPTASAADRRGDRCVSTRRRGEASGRRRCTCPAATSPAATRPSAGSRASARIETLLRARSRAPPRGRAACSSCSRADSHPRRPALGRMVGLRRTPPARTVRIRPEDVAPSILARAGVPAARGPPGPPVARALLRRARSRRRPSRPTALASPPAARAAPATDREYLEKLKPGYLNES